jgi:hypothetical protein
MNVIVDVAAYLFLESLLSLVELVEASTLPLMVTLVLRGFLDSRGIRRSGLTFLELLSELVEWTVSACCWRTKHSRLGSWGISAFLLGGVLSTSSQLA